MLKWSSKQSTFKIQWCMTMLVYFVPSCLLRHVWPKSIKFSFLQTLQLLGTKLRAHFNCYKICREKWQNYVSKPVPKSWNRPASLFVLSRIQWLRKWMTCNGSLQVRAWVQWAGPSTCTQSLNMHLPTPASLPGHTHTLTPSPTNGKYIPTPFQTIFTSRTVGRSLRWLKTPSTDNLKRKR